MTIFRITRYLPRQCRAVIQQVFQRKPGTPEIYENYGSMDAVLDAVKLEIGLAVVPKTSVSRLSQTDRCVVRDLDPPHIQILLLIRCRHHPCGESARKMLGYARCCGPKQTV